MAGLAAMAWDNANLRADLVAAGTGLVTDAGLTTAVLISLFTDARARTDDVLPAPPMPGAVGDRRGWLGDALATIEGDRIGSRLWLLSREKQTEQTRRRAIDYANEALAWLISDSLATAVTVSAAWLARGVLGLTIAITQASGTVLSVTTSVPAGQGTGA